MYMFQSIVLVAWRPFAHVPSSADSTSPSLDRLQQVILRQQVSAEDSFVEVAKLRNNAKGSVIICDRGTLDGEDPSS